MTISIHNKIEIETIIPKEVPNYPGFYYYPCNDKLAVSKDSRFLNLNTGQLIKLTKKKSRFKDQHYRYVISFPMNENIIINKDCNKTNSAPRILARTFIGRPLNLAHIPYVKLHVNHIDLNPSNNSLDNLEWCTASENNNHCFDNLANNNQKPIEIKNINTGEITIYRSLTYATLQNNSILSFLFITRTTLANYLKISKYGFKCENYLIRYLGSKYSWDKITLDIKDYCIFYPVDAKNLYNDLEIHFKTISECARHFNVSRSSLQVMVQKDYKKRRLGYWVLKLPDDNSYDPLDIMSPISRTKTIYDRSFTMTVSEDQPKTFVYQDIYRLHEATGLDIEEVMDSIRKNKIYKKDNIEIHLLMHYSD